MRKCFPIDFPRVLRNLPASLAIRYWLRLVGSGSVVYVITCLLSGEQYVGESGEFPERMDRHIRDLMSPAHRHHSKAMMRAFGAYGLDAFNVDILENCDVRSDEYRKEKERYYISVLRPAFNT